MPKNIVICCDGTGNQINWKLSNVLMLFRVLQKTPEQLVHHSPGVGTVGDFDQWQRRLRRPARHVLSLLVSPWWLALSAFAGLNMIQAAFTGFCPAAIAFKAIGLKAGEAFR